MPTRRQFLLSATLAAPAARLLAEKSSEAPPVIGAGSHRFTCQHDWGTLPDGHSWGMTHGVAFDSQGLVYIAHTGGPGSVFVFDPAGRFLRSLAPQYQGAGHGLAIRQADGGKEFLYLAALADRGLAKFTLTGDLVWEKPAPAASGRYSHGELFRPSSISFTPDGGFHLADGHGTGFIHRFDDSGAWLSTFGGPGDAPGQFRTPHGLQLDTRHGAPRLAVCDRAAGRLQFLTLDGQPLGELPGLRWPSSIDSRQGLLLVAEFLGGLVLIDEKDQIITRFGHSDTPPASPAERPIGRFNRPHAAAFHPDGSIFVVEALPQGRVTRLVPASAG